MTKYKYSSLLDDGPKENKKSKSGAFIVAIVFIFIALLWFLMHYMIVT